MSLGVRSVPLVKKTKEENMATEDKNDKGKALESAIGQIEKQFGKGSIMKLGENLHMNIEAISTGALSLDLALGVGGLPRGRVVEVFGPESSGKSTLALHVVAEARTTRPPKMGRAPKAVAPMAT